LIKASLKGVGQIYNNGNGAYQYRVYSMKDLSVIIAHFDKYPLLTQKLADEGAARAYVFFFSFKRKMRRGDKSRPRTKLSFI
jgi:hypothetical protein